MHDETQFSKARIEMLCDGVFAIAMTLLVLELKVPDLPAQVSAAELFHALGEQRLSYLAFALTFLLAGSFWVQHHVLFHYVARATRGLAILNLLFLMFVALLPFTTSLLARFGSQAGTAYYFANQFILALLLLTQWLLAGRARLLSGSSGDPKRVRFSAVLGAFTVLLGSLLVASIVWPRAAAYGALPGVIGVLLVRVVAAKRLRARERAGADR